MHTRPKCSCSGATDLLFSCSRAADIAEIGDRAVRTLHKTGDAKMFCLAGIAGKVESSDVTTRGADCIVVVDDCDSDSAKKTMELGGNTEFIHVRVSDLWMETGKTPVTEERIAVVVTKLRELLGRRPEVGEA